MYRKHDQTDKFFIGNKTLALSGILFVVSVLLYLACLTIEHQQGEIQQMGLDVNDKLLFCISVFSDVLLAMMSVFGAAVISTFFIDVRKSNSLHKEIISEDVLLAMEYYDNKLQAI